LWTLALAEEKQTLRAFPQPLGKSKALSQIPQRLLRLIKSNSQSTDGWWILVIFELDDRVWFLLQSFQSWR
jgi:hypothetical protein